jgi:tRNA threonylcarbamoyl adenosine modification protein YeaZ
VKLLAWDTSSKAGAIVALEWSPQLSTEWKDVRLVSEFAFNVDSTHSERLVWGIHQTLEAARWRLEEIDIFGVGVGPGSFTGLRIGITTARTLAHVFKKPLIGVSSLAVIARPVALHFSQPGFDFEAWVVATTDACKGELFALWGRAKDVARCSRSPDGDSVEVGGKLWKKNVSEIVLEPSLLMQALGKQMKAPGRKSKWIAVGEGRKRYSDAWSKLSRSKELISTSLFPDFVQGRYLGQLAWEAHQAGWSQDGLFVFPKYLRASDAELKLKAGLLKTAPVREIVHA